MLPFLPSGKVPDCVQAKIPSGRKNPLPKASRDLAVSADLDDIAVQPIHAGQRHFSFYPCSFSVAVPKESLAGWLHDQSSLHSTKKKKTSHQPTTDGPTQLGIWRQKTGCNHDVFEGVRLSGYLTRCHNIIRAR